MREAKKIRLRHAYFGPLTLREIAKANAVGEKMLERFWREEKLAGRIANVPRPHFAKYCAPAPAPEPVLVEADDIADVSGETPIGDFNRRFERESDEMVEALRRHHPDTHGRHLAPAAWLRFDAKGMPTPSHVMLMRMCRVLDVLFSLARFVVRAPSQGTPA